MAELGARAEAVIGAFERNRASQSREKELLELIRALATPSNDGDAPSPLACVTASSVLANGRLFADLLPKHVAIAPERAVVLHYEHESAARSVTIQCNCDASVLIFSQHRQQVSFPAVFRVTPPSLIGSEIWEPFSLFLQRGEHDLTDTLSSITRRNNDAFKIAFRSIEEARLQAKQEEIDQIYRLVSEIQSRQPDAEPDTQDELTQALNSLDVALRDEGALVEKVLSRRLPSIERTEAASQHAEDLLRSLAAKHEDIAP